MDAGSITPKQGIWRASYRLTLRDAIIGCREAEACEAARHLAQLGLETLHRDLQRVKDEVLEHLGSHQTIDAQLRQAVLRTVMDGITEQAQSMFQVDTWDLVPATVH